MKKRTVIILVLDLLLALFVGVKTNGYRYANGDLSFEASFLLVTLLFSPSIYIVLKGVAKKWEAHTLRKQ